MANRTSQHLPAAYFLDQQCRNTTPCACIRLCAVQLSMRQARLCRATNPSRKPHLLIARLCTQCEDCRGRTGQRRHCQLRYCQPGAQHRQR